MRPGVAAGHPATADAGLEILADGGTAADAAVAACLASCVAETVMTGLLGGGHAIYFDAATGTAEHLDSFVSVPGLDGRRGAPLVELHVPFGEELVHYAIGVSSCAVPGVPAGLAELSRRFGRLPWRRLCEPALRLASSGVPMPPAHASCLAMLAPVMTLGEGSRIYAPGGKLLAPGEELRQPGLVRAVDVVAAEGPGTFYSGSLAEALLALMDDRAGLVSRNDLARYRAEWVAPAGCRALGNDVATRAGLSRVPSALTALSPRPASHECERVAALLAALAPAGPEAHGHTTNVTVVDAAGSACVLTTSLGLGSGDWLAEYDLHLNSMLGETDLLVGELEPGRRMESMMAPLVALDGDGLALAAGAAGGTRLRSALVQVVAGLLVDRLETRAAVDRPRLHPAGETVHVEPGFEDPTLTELEQAGWHVRRWPERHHYFGGVSAITRSGAAGDPRRSGAARLL